MFVLHVQLIAKKYQKRARGITPLCGAGTITSSGIAQFKLQQTLSLYSLTKLLNTMVGTRKMTTLKAVCGYEICSSYRHTFKLLTSSKIVLHTKLLLFAEIN